MKVGSIVVCLYVDASEDKDKDIKWLPVMDEKTPYMIRSIKNNCASGSIGVLFEEGVIGLLPSGSELQFPIEKVREILPPENISEQIEEFMKQPVTS